MNQHFSRIAFWISALAIAITVLAFPRYNNRYTEAVLAWDVSGYYLYLPAVFIYKDIKELKFLPGIIEKYQPSYSPDQAFAHESGAQVMKYPAGMALLYLPFFLIAHAVAQLTDYPADGFSQPYQVAVLLGSALVAIAGLWFLRKNLLRFFGERVAGLTLLLMALGTNYFNYATFDAAMPHVWLFAILSLLVHFTARWHERPNLRDATGMGICVGLAALIRPTELIFALVPLLWGIAGPASLLKKTKLLAKHLPQLLLAGVMVAAIGAVQLVYWKTVTEEWLVYSYQDQGFSFRHPHFMDVFFSYRKGWFVYTPLMLFAVAGFWFLWKKQRDLFLPITCFFLINTWIVCAWDIWWYGGAFGQRAMIASYALLAFPLAAFIDWLSGTPLFVKWTMGALLTGCLALNLFQTYQAHWGPWEADMMNRAYFWRIFANVENRPADRLLLDTNEGFSGERINLVTIFSTDFEDRPDTTGLSRERAASGAFSLYVDQERLESEPVFLPRTQAMSPGKMLHIAASFCAPIIEGEPWWMPQLVVQFEREGAAVHERLIRPARLLPKDKWIPMGMDIRIPNVEFDRLRIFLRNPRSRVSLFMDDLRVEIHSPLRKVN